MDLSLRNHPNYAYFREAWGQALPIVFGYLPIGFAFGVLAIKAGISAANTLAMSLLVYAGSAQLIAVGLISAGVSPWATILTTFVVNLRHLLMSAALSPYLRGWPRSLLALFAFELTDESFAVHSTRFARLQSQQESPKPATALTINLISQLAWVLGTLLGIVAGDLIQDVRPFGLDYALIAMFAALLVFQLKDHVYIIVAGFAGLASTALLLTGVSQWNVMIAAVVAATLGVALESWIKRQSS